MPTVIWESCVEFTPNPSKKNDPTDMDRLFLIMQYNGDPLKNWKVEKLKVEILSFILQPISSKSVEN